MKRLPAVSFMIAMLVCICFQGVGRCSCIFSGYCSYSYQSYGRTYDLDTLDVSNSGLILLSGDSFESQNEFMPLAIIDTMPNLNSITLGEFIDLNPFTEISYYDECDHPGPGIPRYWTQEALSTPVPPAIYLLGSVLACLVGIRKKFKE